MTRLRIRTAAGLATLAGLGALGALGALAATARVRRQWRALQLADPSLLTPLAVVPFSVTSDRVARLMRRPIPVREPLAPGVTVEVREISGLAGQPAVQIRILRPSPTATPTAASAPTGALLWLHGGGFVGGNPESYDPLCSRIAAALGIPVVSVRYRLAPEHPFPAGLDDATAALRWLHQNTSSLHIDPTRIAVGGDSAGGGLAASLAQRAFDEGLQVAFQVLLYPMLDDRTVLRARRDDEWTLVWNPPSNRYAWGAYLGHEPGLEEPRPYAVPARRDSLVGLAAAWVGVGDIDLFHVEDVAYALRLREDGVTVTLHIEPGMYHGAPTVAGRHPRMQALEARLLEALRTNLC